MRAHRSLALAGVMVMTVALTACGKTNPEPSSAIGNVGTGAPVTNPSPGQTSPKATATPIQTGTTAPAKATTKAADTAPRIVTFEVSQQPECPIIATSDAPFHKDGTPIKLRWKAVNVPGVSLSLDAPTWFDTYKTGNYDADLPASGEIEISFVCDTNDQPNTNHTYTLDTLGSVDVRKSITVTKRTSP
jgi:hypothetical protein